MDSSTYPTKGFSATHDIHNQIFSPELATQFRFSAKLTFRIIHGLSCVHYRLFYRFNLNSIQEASTINSQDIYNFQHINPS
jgi:hypothetical protein